LIDKPAGAAIHRSFRVAPIRKGVSMANMSTCVQNPPNEPAGPVKRTKLRWGESSPDANPRLELGDTAGFVVAL
jgi:hypothetical protein